MAKWALLFPGQGSQYVGMGKDLTNNFKAAADVFAEADEVLHEHITKLCFEGPEADLKLTMNTQPAILTASVAVLKVLQSETDITPSMVAGHSLGEYSALVASGALSFADAVRTVRKRGTYMQEAVPVGVGAMAAVLGMERNVLEKICEECSQDESAVPANYNCPGQIVISGHTGAVERAAARAEEEGAKRVVMLQVSAPFHSPLMKPAAERLAEALEPIEIMDMSVSVLSNVEADYYPSSNDVKSLLTRQVDHPVRWQEQVEKMLAEGADQFLELGPGRVLLGLMKKIDRKASIKNIENSDGLKKVVEML